MPMGLETHGIELYVSAVSIYVAKKIFAIKIMNHLVHRPVSICIRLFTLVGPIIIRDVCLLNGRGSYHTHI